MSDVKLTNGENIAKPVEPEKIEPTAKSDETIPHTEIPEALPPADGTDGNPIAGKW